MNTVIDPTACLPMYGIVPISENVNVAPDGKELAGNAINTSLEIVFEAALGEAEEMDEAGMTTLRGNSAMSFSTTLESSTVHVALPPILDGTLREPVSCSC